MLTREKQAVQVFRRVRDFLKTEAPEVGLGSVGGVVTQLDDVILQIETYAREQDARTRQASAGTQLSRSAISSVRREFMRPVANAARTLFPSDPDLLAAFSMPRTRDYQGVIAAAEAMAQMAKQHTAKFTGAGLSADFVDRMAKAAAELRTVIDARAADLGRRAASTAGLRREYARGRDIVRMLDDMVSPRLAGTPSRAAEWRSISRFARLSSPASAAPPVDDSPAGSAPAPVSDVPPAVAA